MGLSITYYEKIQMAKGNEAFDETGSIKEGWVQFYHCDDFPGRADEIKDRYAYRFEKSHHFRAGSYGGYNRWRNQLAQMAGYPECEHEMPWGTKKSHAAAVWDPTEIKEGPFFELINFSDCEGVIGASISKKLAGDFQHFQECANKHPDSWFREKYTDWRKAFEIASNSGAVRFC